MPRAARASTVLPMSSTSKLRMVKLASVCVSRCPPDQDPHHQHPKRDDRWADDRQDQGSDGGLAGERLDQAGCEGAEPGDRSEPPKPSRVQVAERDRETQ